MKLIKTNDSIYVKVDELSATVSKENPWFEKFEQMIEELEYEEESYLEEDLYELLEDYLCEQKELSKDQATIEKYLKGSSILFQDSDGKIYFKTGDNSKEIPLHLAARILLAEQDEDHKKIKAYKNFWGKAVLNPNNVARDNMLAFVEKHDIFITEQGNLVTYRLVAPKSNTSYLNADVAFITGAYNDPSRESVTDEYYDKISGELLPVEEGTPTLESQYEEVSALKFTDFYTKTFTIELNKLVSMPRKDCDETQATCSSGLHTAAFNWLQNNAHFGSIALIALVNPADVVSVPMADSYGKMRSCSYLPVGVFSYDDNIKVEQLAKFNLTDGITFGDYENELVMNEAYTDENFQCILKDIYNHTVENALRTGELSFEILEQLRKLLKNNNE